MSFIHFLLYSREKKNTKFSLNGEMDGLGTGFIILGKNNSLYHAAKLNKIPGFQFVAYPTTTTDLFRLKPILKLSEIV